MFNVLGLLMPLLLKRELEVAGDADCLLKGVGADPLLPALTKKLEVVLLLVAESTFDDAGTIGLGVLDALLPVLAKKVEVVLLLEADDVGTIGLGVPVPAVGFTGVVILLEFLRLSRGPYFSTNFDNRPG